MQLSEAVTRLSTAAVLSLRLEGGDGRLCEMWMSKNGFTTMQPLHGTQDDSLYRVMGTERTNKGQKIEEFVEVIPVEETRGTLGTGQCIARCRSRPPSAPHAHLHCVVRWSIVGPTPDIGGQPPGVDAQFTACLRVRLFIQMGATRARMAATAAYGLQHSARWKVIRTCACSISTRAPNACTLRRFRRAG